MPCFLALVVSLATLLAAVGASAQVTVDTPWTRALPPVSANGVVYLTLRNTGSEPERLVAASTPVARMVHLHETRVQDGVARMGPVQTLEIPPGESVELTPGGLHLMLMGLSQPLAEGDAFVLRLRFEPGGEVDVEVPVLAPDALAPE